MDFKILSKKNKKIWNDPSQIMLVGLIKKKYGRLGIFFSKIEKFKKLKIKFDITLHLLQCFML